MGYGEEEERLYAGEVGSGGGEGEELRELKYSRGFLYLCDRKNRSRDAADGGLI